MATCVVPEIANDEAAVHEAIARRAREIWQERGCTDGHAAEDWAQAEREVRGQLTVGLPSGKRRIVIRAGAVVYTGEYDVTSCGSYCAGELREGDPVKLHFEQDKMFVRLPGGKQLETRILDKRPC